MQASAASGSARQGQRVRALADARVLTARASAQRGGIGGGARGLALSLPCQPVTDLFLRFVLQSPTATALGAQLAGGAPGNVSALALLLDPVGAINSAATTLAGFFAAEFAGQATGQPTLDALYLSLLIELGDVLADAPVAGASQPTDAVARALQPTNASAPLTCLPAGIVGVTNVTQLTPLSPLPPPESPSTLGVIVGAVIGGLLLLCCLCLLAAIWLQRRQRAAEAARVAATATARRAVSAVGSAKVDRMTLAPPGLRAPTAGGRGAGGGLRMPTSVPQHNLAQLSARRISLLETAASGVDAVAAIRRAHAYAARHNTLAPGVDAGDGGVAAGNLSAAARVIGARDAEAGTFSGISPLVAAAAATGGAGASGATRVRRPGVRRGPPIFVSLMPSPVTVLGAGDASGTAGQGMVASPRMATVSRLALASQQSRRIGMADAVSAGNSVRMLVPPALPASPLVSASVSGMAAPDDDTGGGLGAAASGSTRWISASPGAGGLGRSLRGAALISADDGGAPRLILPSPSRRHARAELFTADGTRVSLQKASLNRRLSGDAASFAAAAAQAAAAASVAVARARARTATRRSTTRTASSPRDAASSPRDGGHKTTVFVPSPPTKL